MSKVFVSGGTGFVGSYVVRELLAAGHEVLVYDLFVQYVNPYDNQSQLRHQLRLKDIIQEIRLVRGSVTDQQFLRRTLLQFKPSHLIHLASMPLANLAIEHPEEAFSSIVGGTMTLLETLQDVGTVERLVHISSSMVYGDFQYEPADEDHPKNPKEVYGGLKLCSEVIARTYGQLYGLDYCIIRPTAVYGPTDGNNRVLSVFLNRALHRLPLAVNGPETRLDFTYVKDTAAGIVAACFSPRAHREVFNISRGEGRSLGEAAEIVARLVPGTEVIFERVDERMPRRGTLDIRRAAERLGFVPRYSLEEGLQEYLRFLVEPGP